MQAHSINIISIGELLLIKKSTFFWLLNPLKLIVNAVCIIKTFFFSVHTKDDWEEGRGRERRGWKDAIRAVWVWQSPIEQQA